MPRSPWRQQYTHFGHASLGNDWAICTYVHMYHCANDDQEGQMYHWSMPNGYIFLCIRIQLWMSFDTNALTGSNIWIVWHSILWMYPCLVVATSYNSYQAEQGKAACVVICIHILVWTSYDTNVSTSPNVSMGTSFDTVDVPMLGCSYIIW